MRVKTVVLEGYCLNPGDLTWKGLEKLGEVTVYDRTPPELLLERAAGADALVTNKTPLGKAELAELGAWRHIGVLATGERGEVVSLHYPLFPETQGMTCASTLLPMKPSAFLLNTSRGPLVVDQDLADAPNAGMIAGAGVDILSLEPPAGGSPLLSTAENLASFAGRSPRNVVTR